MTLDNRLLYQDSQASLTAKKILEALQGLRFGAVEIIVHDGRIVQIERKEKLRLNISCPAVPAD
ncbi:YezD family protein [Methylocaldum sp.]|uniref:YezD family protein n=1 Tax=Methylocaldum sp. TaxID=1969727 RepID=UPI002D2DD9BD|nr:YezD family protein [Methylocaldum sp.]HYE35942.1 YezD family protein [Methylocaldum sp.]